MRFNSVGIPSAKHALKSCLPRTTRTKPAIPCVKYAEKPSERFRPSPISRTPHKHSQHSPPRFDLEAIFIITFHLSTARSIPSWTESQTTRRRAYSEAPRWQQPWISSTRGNTKHRTTRSSVSNIVVPYFCHDQSWIAYYD